MEEKIINQRLKEHNGKNKYFIIGLSDVNWQSGWTSRRRIFTGLASRNWDVFFSSGPLSIWNRSQVEWKSAPMFNNIYTEDNVIVDKPGKLFSIWPGHNFYNHIIFKLYSFVFSKLIKKKILICFHPKYIDLIRYINPEILIYYLYDDLSNSPGWSLDLEKKENQMIDKCDLILGFSSEMLVRIKNKTKKPVFPLPLGVDMHLFVPDKSPYVPDDISLIPSPRIGYTGYINQKIDWKLVHFLANSRKNYNWVFIGKETGVINNSFSNDELSYAWWKKCNELSNFHYLGFRPHSRIPEYVNHMDLNIMPYLLKGGWWELGYPLKMHEYLATGKPVVSSDLSAVREFENVIDIAGSYEEWLNAIDNAINDSGRGTIADRIMVARENDWEQRIDQLEDYLYKLTYLK